MEAVRRMFRKLWFVARRERFDSELGEEMAFHREQMEKEHRTDGLTPESAHYAAARQFGNATRLQERSHEMIAFQFETVLKDLRYALRQLRKNPGFTATAILILGLGIGASTAIFSAVNPILFEPLPYPHAGRIMMIWEKRADGGPSHPNFATYVGLRERNRSFDAIGAMKPWQPTMTGPAEPERFEGQRVSAAYFRVLGVSPALGRDLQASDDQFHGPNVVILSDTLWRRRFGGERMIVGRQVTLDDNIFTIIGVMPRAFENVLAPSAEIWAPLQYDPSLPPDSREWGHHLRMVGRLQPGVSQNEATSELDVILQTLAKIYAKGYAGSGGPSSGFIVTSLQDDVTRGVKPALLAVLGAVALLLVIACVNVTNLVLARGVQRRGEFAVRAALGAGQTRMVRQLLTESLLLAAVGGALGMIVAQWGVRGLVALSPPGLPRAAAIGVNAPVFAFGLVVSTVVGLAFGLIPALPAARIDPQRDLQQGSRHTTAGHRVTRSALVVTEVALALVLLVSAGLLLRSLHHLFAVDVGFDSSHLLTMQVQESGRRYDKDSDRLRFFEQALEAVRRAPGVSSAGFTSQLPLSGDFDVYGIQFEKDNNGKDDDREGALRYAVTPGYLETMRIPIRRGRLLDAHDTAGAPKVVLINQSLASRKFPGQEPVGKRVCVRCDVGPNRPWATIVGVVSDVRQVSLEASDVDAVYLPTTQWYWADEELSLVVRTRGDATALAPAIRKAIWSVDKDQPIVRIATMDRLVAVSAAERHFALIIFEAFALVGLVLAATGIYGVLAGSVSERMRELAVRSALGASRGNILALVVRQGMTLAGLGVVIGLSGAVLASQAIAALLFGISRLDPITYLGVIALLMGVSVVACWIPAWRAARVDPAITLRAE
ncbi:MAG TPA: ABC transporter permease [Candidatus Angelobacter sp.]